MNINRITGFLEGVVLASLGGLTLCLAFAGGVQAEEDGWLVRQRHASPNGLWILHESGTTELQPLPPGLEGKDIDEDSPLPPGFDRGRKKGWEKEGGLKKQEGPRTAPGFVDTRVYGDGKPRTPPGFVDTRVYGDGTPRTPPGFVDTRTYGTGEPRQKPEMRDPYGHSKDNRKEETGNRGRVIRDPDKGEEPAPAPLPEPVPEPESVVEPEPVTDPEPVIEPVPVVEPPAEEYPDQLYTDSWTFWALKYAADYGINPYFWLIELSGYSPLEAQFLMEHTMEQVYDAYSVTGEEDFLRELMIDNTYWDLQTENLIADFQTYGSRVPAVSLSEEEKAAIIAYSDPYHVSFSAGILKGFEDPRSIYYTDYEIDPLFSVNTVSR